MEQILTVWLPWLMMVNSVPSGTITVPPSGKLARVKISVVIDGLLWLVVCAVTFSRGRLTVGWWVGWRQEAAGRPAGGSGMVGRVRCRLVALPV